MKPSFLFCLLLFLTSAQADDRAGLRHLSGAGVDAEKDGITFTDRAIFDSKLTPYLSKAPEFLTDWEKRIRLPDPPANSSVRTAAELHYLRSLENRRTNEEKDAINRELEVVGMKIGAYELAITFEKNTSRPATRKLLLAGMHDMEIIVFRLKARFNRARPTHLTSDLHPCIEVPGHPAYPSGHATQAHLLAYLFAELEPSKSGEFLASASEIARHREVAGVHYPSDSEAGQMLARQIADMLLVHEEFQKLLVAAKKEWE